MTEVLRNFLSLSIQWQSLSSHFLSAWRAGWGLESKVLPTLSKDQAHDHLRILKVHKCLGPRVLRDVVDAVAKPLT